jgi:DNA polymerase V
LSFRVFLINVQLSKEEKVLSMSEATPSKRGGQRPGAGRKSGTGPFGEPTQPIRVPLSLLPSVKALLSCSGKQPGGLYLLPFTAQPSALSLPLYGSRVPAGFPSPADDHLDKSLDLNDHLVQHPAATFFVKVQGHSMIGAGIHHGDLLVVDRSLEPKHQAIVIAVVNGDLTVKRLKVENGRVWLMPENPDFSPLEITDGMDLHIWGVVAHVVHSL